MCALRVSTTLPALLYLVPFALALGALARRGRSLVDLGLALPGLVAAELLVVLLVSRITVLENAILLVHGLFGLVAAALFLRGFRRRELEIPAGLGLRAVGSAFLASWLCVYVSQLLSRECHNADRAWHIPLATSMRGQTLPFSNVYEPGVRLAYHYSGDIYGVIFQVLSGGKIHQSLALALAHDVAYGLIGVTFVLCLVGFGTKRLLTLPLVAGAAVLAGPFTFMRNDRFTADGGYNFISLLKVGFRPHVTWAMLFLVALAFTLFAMVRRAQRDEAATFPRFETAILAVLVAALGITDEASVAIFGLALGAVWLAIPHVLAPKRLHGLIILAILLVSLVAAQILFSGSLAPGAPKHTWLVVPWRSPGYYHPPIPLKQEAGRMYLYLDAGPVVLVTLAGAFVAFLKRRKDAIAIWLFFAIVTAVGLFLLTRLEVDKEPLEAHRFMTAAMALSVPCGALFLIDDGTRQGDNFTFAHVLCLIAWVGGASSSLDWYKDNKSCTKPERYSSREDFFRTDCQRDTDAKFGERPVPTYLAQEVWYVYAGCRPVYSSGPPPSTWKVKVGIAKFGPPALEEVVTQLSKPDEAVRVICPPHNGATADRACAFVRQRDMCVPAGRLVSVCTVPADTKEALLAAAGPAPKETTPANKDPQGEVEGGH